MELKTNETKSFDSLSVTLTGGGHKILMNEKGKRGGDLSFAEIVLETPEHPAENFRLYHPEGKDGLRKHIEFDNYLIAVKDMEWNGISIELSIERKSSPENNL